MVMSKKTLGLGIVAEKRIENRTTEEEEERGIRVLLGVADDEREIFIVARDAEVTVRLEHVVGCE